MTLRGYRYILSLEIIEKRQQYCSRKKYSTEELSKRSKPGVVTVLTDKASGSGFVVRHIKNQTLILTNSHVIQGANKINVEWSDGNSG